jgi:hypothetical protein
VADGPDADHVVEPEVQLLQQDCLLLDHVLWHVQLLGRFSGSRSTGLLVSGSRVGASQDRRPRSRRWADSTSACPHDRDVQVLADLDDDFVTRAVRLQPPPRPTDRQGEPAEPGHDLAVRAPHLVVDQD